MVDIGAVFANLADTGEPPLISQLARASWLAGVAKSAVKLGLNDRLSGGQRGAAALAKEMGINPLHMEWMLNSCVSAGLMEKVGNEFRNSKEAARYLVKGQPAYYGEAFTYLSSLGALFDQLDTAMTSGETVSHEAVFKTEEEEKAYWTNYMLAMDQWGGRMQEDMLLGSVDFSGRKKLLDVGCGSGVYTMAVCAKHPGIKGVLFDQKKALPVALALVEQRGLSGRISSLSGNYYTDDLGSGYDAVLFSGVLIQESPEGQVTLLKRAYDAMNKGGIVIVQDILKIGPYTETSPKIALESLVATVFYGGAGGVVSGDDTEGFMTKAGFTDTKQIPLPGVYSIVTGIKP